jgi:hypothetical protein
MDVGPLSLTELRREVGELRKDYVAFSTAYDMIRHRVLESTELDPPRHPQLHEWSGSRATCGALEMSIHAIERTILEYNALIEKVENGEIENSDRPALKLVDGDRHE